MKKGDIFWAKDKSCHPHPIVYLSDSCEQGRFSACILSTKQVLGNVKMQKEHFYEKNENGEIYSFNYNNSYLVTSATFLKEEIWLESDLPCGRLTEEGILFIDENLGNIDSIYHPIPIYKKYKTNEK